MSVSKIDLISRARNFPVERAVSLLKISLSKQGKFPCPQHKGVDATVNVIKARNCCVCSECGINMSPLDLVKKILGIEDDYKAALYLFGRGEDGGEKKIVTRNYPVLSVDDYNVKTAKILTDFFMRYTREADIAERRRLSYFHFSNEVFLKNIIAVLDGDEHEIMYELKQNWGHEDLLASGLIKNNSAGEDFLVFNKFKYLLPHIYKKINSEGIEERLVMGIKGIAVKESRISEVYIYAVEWWPYLLENVDWTKKIIICEGELSALSILSNSKQYSPVALTYPFLNHKIIPVFKQMDVTVALNHQSAAKGLLQKSITEKYNRSIQNIVNLFRSELNQKVNILKTSIGEDLVMYFRRCRRKI